MKEKYSDTGKTDMKIKKRWDDDVVFKNCSRAEPDARCCGKEIISLEDARSVISNHSLYRGVQLYQRQPPQRVSQKIHGQVHQVECEWCLTGTGRKDFVNILDFFESKLNSMTVLFSDVCLTLSILRTFF